MRKKLLLVARILIAALGIGYIVWSLTWMDQIQVPTEVRLPDGRVLDKPESFPIVEGDQEAFDRQQRITISTGRDATDAHIMEVPPYQRGSDNNQFQFKPGVKTTLSNANVALLVLGLLLEGLIYPMQGFRWRILLRARGLNVSFGKSFRLVMVGSFFNYCMPVGTTGGDVVKAYYAAKGSGRRTDAIMSVVFDRIVGLLGLIVLCGTVGLFMLHEPVARRITVWVWLILILIIAAGAVYFIPTWRRRFGVEWLVGKLPGRDVFGRIDAAAVAYRHHKLAIIGAVAVSVLVHWCLVISAVVTCYALGITHRFGVLATMMPVLFASSALPITYQGLGVMEGVGIPLLVEAGKCTVNQLIGMLMIYRLYMVTFSMLGSIYLLRGDIHMHPQGNDTSAGPDELDPHSATEAP